MTSLRGDQWRASALVSSVMQCQLLRDATTLKETISWAVKLALPPEFQTFVLEKLDKGDIIASSSTVQRSVFLLDAAYILSHRRLLTLSDCELFIMTDSSPQAGEDWQITKVYYLPKPCVQ